MADLEELKGSKFLIEEWPKIDRNVKAVNSEIVGHKASDAAHAAEAITYAGGVAGAADVKGAIDNLKTELTQAVIAGDSGPEAATARNNSYSGETYDTLKDRLDAEYEGVTAQLADTAKHTGDQVNVKALGATGGGILDDTFALQQTLDNYDNIFFPSGTYKFSQLVISQSNKKITFGPNVILKSSLNLNDDRAGYIDIRGTVSATKYFLQQTVNRNTNVLSLTPSDASNFAPGDIIEFDQIRPFSGSSLVTNETEHRQQNSYAIVTIKSVNTATGRIETKETIPYQFLVANQPTIAKVNAVKNIEIIGASTKYDKMGVDGYGAFFYVTFAYNVTIKGFDCFNGGGKGIQTYKVNKFLFSDIKYSLPTSTGPAKGDGMVINLSGYGVIERCNIYDAGRGIDFATGWNCMVRNCMTFQCGLSTHGLLSAFITFDNCMVYGKDNVTVLDFSAFTIGNVDYMFDEYITFTNCAVFGGFYAFTIVDQSQNLVFDNCRANNTVYGFTSTTGKYMTIRGCTFNNCDIDLNLADVINTKVINCTMYNETFVTRGNASIITSGASSGNEFIGLNVIRNRSQILYLQSTATIGATPLVMGEIVKLKNCTFKNLTYGEQLFFTNGTEIINSEFNDRVAIYGTERVTFANSIASGWRLVNSVVKNFIVKSNLFTDYTRTVPTLATNAALNIYNDNNIFMVNA